MLRCGALHSCCGAPISCCPRQHHCSGQKATGGLPRHAGGNRRVAFATVPPVPNVVASGPLANSRTSVWWAISGIRWWFTGGPQLHFCLGRCFQQLLQLLLCSIIIYKLLRCSNKLLRCSHRLLRCF